jgi:hypothetical protein
MKSEKTLLLSLLSYALGYPIVKNDDRCQLFHKFISDIPSSTRSSIFGVFVGVTRSTKDTLSKWPEDIHGSIGHYRKIFSVLSEDELCEQTYQVAYSAMWKDDRRNYFPHILSDPDAILDVKFMLLPLKGVEYNGKFSHGGELFSNKDMGIIVQDRNGYGATYLPNVFPTEKWEYVRDSLLSKGDLTYNKDVKFYAYKTLRFEIKIGEFFHYASSHKYTLTKLYTSLGKNFLNFLQQAMMHCKVPCIPYSVVDKKVIINPNEFVRNVGTLQDIIDMVNTITPSTQKNKLEGTFNENVLWYTNKIEKNLKEERQASAFLLSVLKALNIKKDVQKEICTSLYDQIENLEKEFELGEVLQSLCKNCKRLQAMVVSRWKKLRDPKSIFELNWHAQVYKEIAKLDLPHDPQINKKRHLLYCKCIDMVNTWAIDHMETNYLAVAWEALTALKQNEHIQETLLAELMKRCDVPSGLFLFKDGTARIDISGHVYRGFINFLDSPN